MTVRSELSDSYTNDLLKESTLQNFDPIDLYSEFRKTLYPMRQSEKPGHNLALNFPTAEELLGPTSESVTGSNARQTAPNKHDKPPAQLPEAEKIFAERDRVAKTLRKYMEQMDFPDIDSGVKDGNLSKNELMTFLFLSDNSKNLSEQEREDLMKALREFGWIAGANDPADLDLRFVPSTISTRDIDRWLEMMPWQLDPQLRNIGSADLTGNPGTAPGASSKVEPTNLEVPVPNAREQSIGLHQNSESSCAQKDQPDSQDSPGKRDWTTAELKEQAERKRVAETLGKYFDQIDQKHWYTFGTSDNKLSKDELMNFLLSEESKKLSLREQSDILKAVREFDSIAIADDPLNFQMRMYQSPPTITRDDMTAWSNKRPIDGIEEQLKNVRVRIPHQAIWK